MNQFTVVGCGRMPLDQKLQQVLQECEVPFEWMPRNLDQAMRACNKAIIVTFGPDDTIQDIKRQYRDKPLLHLDLFATVYAQSVIDWFQGNEPTTMLIWIPAIYNNDMGSVVSSLDRRVEWVGDFFRAVMQRLRNVVSLAA